MSAKLHAAADAFHAAEGKVLGTDAQHKALGFLTKYAVVFVGAGAKAVAAALGLPLAADGSLSLDTRDYNAHLETLAAQGVKVAITDHPAA